MLPFGLRSAPKIFNAVADALHWHLERCGIVNLHHYLDDFILVGPPPPHSSQCKRELDLLGQECARLGVPIATHKTVGPSARLTFLGIEIDTLKGELRLPEEKLHRLQLLLSEWGDRKTCTRKDLESLIGHLNHACKVVRSGRSFLRRMIDLLHMRSVSSRRQANAPIRLNSSFRADLAWWQTFTREWNGISFLQNSHQLPVLQMASDASGSWGCGAFTDMWWFQVQWTAETQSLPITVKELLPILVGGILWGRSWRDHQVLCHCDNQAVVACLHSRTSKHEGIMHLLRNLIYIEVHHRFRFVPQYIDKHANHLADDLSHNRAYSFLLKVPLASRYPVPVTQEILSQLLDPQADWVHPHWREQFRDIMNRV